MINNYASINSAFYNNTFLQQRPHGEPSDQHKTFQSPAPPSDESLHEIIYKRHFGSTSQDLVLKLMQFLELFPHLVDKKDHYGKTPLMVCVELGDKRSAYALLQAGADPDARFSNQLSLLHTTVSLEDDEMTALLLAHNANPLAKLPYSQDTPLHLAARHNNKRACRALASQHTCCAVNRLGYIPAVEAYKTGHYNLIHSLLPSNIPIPAQSPSTLNLLRSLKQLDHKQVILELIKDGIAENTPPFASTNPWHAAVAENECDLLRLMLPFVKNINATDFCNRNALHIAIENGNDAAVPLLCLYGCNPLEKDVKNLSALHKAVRHKRPVVDVLLQHKADPNVPGGKKFSTPLLMAAKQKNSSQTVQLLLQYGADPNLPNKKGLTPTFFLDGRERVLYGIPKTAHYKQWHRIKALGASLGLKSVKVPIDGSDFKISASGYNWWKLQKNMLRIWQEVHQELNDLPCALAADRALIKDCLPPKDLMLLLQSKTPAIIGCATKDHSIGLCFYPDGRNCMTMSIINGGPRLGRPIAVWTFDTAHLTSELFEKMQKINKRAFDKEAVAFYYQEMPQRLKALQLTHVENLVHQHINPAGQKDKPNCSFYSLNKSIRFFSLCHKMHFLWNQINPYARRPLSMWEIGDEVFLKEMRNIQIKARHWCYRVKAHHLIAYSHSPGTVSPSFIEMSKKKLEDYYQKYIYPLSLMQKGSQATCASRDDALL